jgi:DnaJ-class molecular chaperone
MRQGADVRIELQVPFLTAVRGDTIEFGMPRRQGTERVKTRIPAGIEDGGTLRLSGKGNPGSPPGDAYLTVRVQKHPLFRREGRDLVCDLPIGIARAALGGKVPVETLDGTATVVIPPGTKSGQRLRLRGRGVPAASGKPAGNLHAVIQIRPPKELDPRSRELLEEFDRLNPDSV